MITMMNRLPATVNSRTSELIMKGIEEVVSLLLKLGACTKPADQVQPYRSPQEIPEYSIENQRIIAIARDYAQMKETLDLIGSFTIVL